MRDIAKSSITVVGVGGAGCRIADAVTDGVRAGAAVVAVNTDARVLEASRAATRLQIGATRTAGLGTGGDAGVGRLAAEDDVELIRGLFSETRFAIVVVGLGGGTGSGAASVILREARDAGALTLCLATQPCGFEGAAKAAAAESALDTLLKIADAVVVVPNDRLFESVGADDLAGAFRQADQTLGLCLCSLIKMIGEPGQINLDFADVRHIVRDSEGTCTIGYGEGTGDDRTGTAVAALLGSPLLEKGKVLSKAQSLLVSIVGGQDLTVKHVGQIMSELSSRVGENCRVTMGTAIDEDWRDRVTITVLASDRRSAMGEAKVAEAPVEYEKQAGKVPRRGRKKSKASQTQTILRLDTYGKGRFKDVEPTILDGEDLDTPTFVRRGIAIER